METKDIKPGNVYDYILQLCVSKSDWKHLNKPFTRPDGMVYATNSFMAVRMPAEKPVIEYAEGETKADEVYPKDETWEKFSYEF